MIGVNRSVVGLLLGVFLLAGCAGGGFIDPGKIRGEADRGASLTEEIAGNLLKVPPEYRPLRVCLLATGVIEVMTDRVRLFDPDKAQAVLGRLLALQSVVDAAKDVSVFWLNSDMADVAFLFARVLVEAGKEKLARILLGGPTIGNFLDIARRAAVTTTKGSAMLRDMDAMIEGLVEGRYSEAQVWQACEERAAQNRKLLGILTGARRALR